jgi:hypothetical protein
MRSFSRPRDFAGGSTFVYFVPPNGGSFFSAGSFGQETCATLDIGAGKTMVPMVSSTAPCVKNGSDSGKQALASRLLMDSGVPDHGQTRSVLPKSFGLFFRVDYITIFRFALVRRAAT